jgi:hypothetical protein
MNKIFLTVALTAMVLVHTSFAQDSTPVPPSPVLTAYFSLKDALVAGNSATSAEFADSFVRILDVAAGSAKPGAVTTAMLKEARAISATKDLKLQREKFATLSSHMLALAKTSRLSPNDVYHQYCPMKKASWLSNSKAIKNPYYGSAMLTCGNVKEIL